MSRTRRRHNTGIRNVSASASPTPPIDGPAATAPVSESSQDHRRVLPSSTTSRPRNTPITWEARKIAAVSRAPSSRSASVPNTSSSTVVAT